MSGAISCCGAELAPLLDYEPHSAEDPGTRTIVRQFTAQSLVRASCLLEEVAPLRVAGIGEVGFILLTP